MDLPRYKVRIKKIDFEVPTRYSDLTYLGGGSYGIVCSAKDATRSNKKDQGHVAIKRIGGVFRDVVDAKRILREMKLLRHLQGHANVVGIHAIFSGPAGAQRFNNVYLVTPLYQSDLFKIIQSDQTLSSAHARYFIYQILRGLKYIHSANIIHRDLKPANLLINSDCGLAICDFGLARGVKDLNDSMRHPTSSSSLSSSNSSKTTAAAAAAASTVQLTHYVVTRWYRAPELLVENENYGKEIDMWSVGCILGEILGRRVLFRGKDYLNQLSKIINILGTPTEQEMYFVKNHACRRMIRTDMSRKRKRSWSSIYPNAEKNALDLLDRLLTFDPAKRITVEEAMRHPYISEYSQPDREPTCEESFNFDFELTVDIEQPSRIRQLMREEMKLYPLNGATHRSSTSTTSTSTRKKKKSPEMERAMKRDRSKTPTSRGAGVGSSDKKRPNNRQSSSPPELSPRNHYISKQQKKNMPSSPTTSATTAFSSPSYPPAPPSSDAPPSSQLTTNAMSRVVSGELRTLFSTMSNEIRITNEKSIKIIEQNIIDEMKLMESRIVLKMNAMVDQIITKRFNEFEQRLEAGDDEGRHHDSGIEGGKGGGMRDSMDYMGMSHMSLDEEGGRTPEAKILQSTIFSK